MPSQIISVLFLLFSSLPSLALVAQSKVTSSFAEIMKETRPLIEEAGQGRTLYVFDIDNTVLKTSSDFGSEHWFLWQKSLIDAGQKMVPAVTNNLNDLFRIQGWIYQLGKMEPVSAEIPDFVREIRSKKALVIALTSRVLSVRDATLKEFANNSMELSTAPELGLRLPSPVYLPYDPQSPQTVGLSPEEIKKYQLNSPQEISFEKGILFTQGQHKGIMLRLFLRYMQTSFSNIVFVDDRSHHIEGMNSVFTDRKENLYSYQFIKAKTWIDAFNSGDKSQAQKAWCLFSAGLVGSIFDEAESSFNHCAP